MLASTGAKRWGGSLMHPTRQTPRGETATSRKSGDPSPHTHHLPTHTTHTHTHYTANTLAMLSLCPLAKHAVALHPRIICFKPYLNANGLGHGRTKPKAV